MKGIAEGNPEPPNVQQVTLTSKGDLGQTKQAMSADWMSGLEVKQYGNEYNAQYNTKGIKDVECAVYGWQVTFARTNMRYLHLQEYDVKYWVEGKSLSTYSKGNADLGICQAHLRTPPGLSA